MPKATAEPKFPDFKTAGEYVAYAQARDEADLAHAIAVLENALVVFSKNGPFLAELGRLHWKNAKRPDIRDKERAYSASRAYDMINGCCQIAPDYVPNLIQLALYYEDCGHPDQAYFVMHDVVRKKNYEPTANQSQMMGRFYKAAGNADMALACVGHAHEIRSAASGSDPKDLEASGSLVVQYEAAAGHPYRGADWATLIAYIRETAGTYEARLQDAPQPPRPMAA